MTEFEVGDTWVNEDEGIAWQVQAVQYEYVVKTRPVDGDGDESDVEVITYPEDSLKRKLKWDDLTVVSDDSDDEDTDEENVCERCGETFDSPRGLSTHKGMAHDSARPDE